MHEELPDPSSPSRIRQRWGAERLRGILERRARACPAGKIARGGIVRVDASPLRAEASGESLAVRHAEASEANAEGVTAERDTRKTGKHKKVRVTGRLDGDQRARPAARAEPHAARRRRRRLRRVLERIDTVAATMGAPVRTETAEAGHACAKVHAGLERRGIEAMIPAKAEPDPAARRRRAGSAMRQATTS